MRMEIASPASAPPRPPATVASRTGNKSENEESYPPEPDKLKQWAKG